MATGGDDPLDHIVRVSTPTNDRTCSSCNKAITDTGDNFCCDCDKWICKTCQSEHNRWLSNHKFVAEQSVLEDVSESDSETSTVPSERYQVCKEHSPSLIRYYCLNCQMKTCAECQLLNHADHKKTTLDERVQDLEQHLENIICNIDEATNSYEARVENLRANKAELNRRVNRVNEVMTIRKQQLINDLVKRYKEAKKDNNLKLCKFTEDVDETLGEVDKEISRNKDESQRYRSKQSELKIDGDLADIDHPGVNKEEFENHQYPKLTSCIGSCITEGTIRCTVKNIDKAKRYQKNYSRDFTIRSLPWKVLVERCEEATTPSLGVFAVCNRSSNETSWSVRASYTVGLLHPSRGKEEIRSDTHTFCKKSSGHGNRSLRSWKEMFDEGYVVDNTITVQVDIRPEAADDVASCLCYNKHTWTTEITIDSD